jgi:hypothetical protein
VRPGAVDGVQMPLSRKKFSKIKKIKSQKIPKNEKSKKNKKTSYIVYTIIKYVLRKYIFFNKKFNIIFGV